MEYIPFKIKSYRKVEFEATFRNICREENINCSQWEFKHEADYTIALIPDYAINKMSTHNFKILEAFKV